MSNATDLAADIAGAYREASAEVGDGPLTVTLIKSGVVDDSDYSSTVPGSETEHSFDGYVSRFSDRDRAGTDIRMGDVKVMLAVGSVEPETGDRLRVEGREFAVVSVEPMMYGGPVVSWTVQARGS